MTDFDYMQEALALAKEAAEMDEVPVGALIVRRGEIIARAKNERELSRLATHHAEIVAIEEACRALGGWRLPESTLYVTLEPCPMCAGAIIHARIERVVFGAHDEKNGAFGGAFDLSQMPNFFRPVIEGGVCEEECRQILSAYFRQKRKK
ncbi:MAG: nucleoside deaminase [Clostridia bacterium]|nr:nucleoside deaminase [Clostridia bacterium]